MVITGPAPQSLLPGEVRQHIELSLGFFLSQQAARPPALTAGGQTPLPVRQFVLAHVLCFFQFTGKALIFVGTLHSSLFVSFLIKKKNY